MLFADRGFHGTSVRDLAEALAQQPSALYKHFPSKEHILAELVTQGFALHHQALADTLLAVDADPVAQIRAIVATHARIHATWPLLATVIHAELHALSPELAAPALALRDQSARLLVRVIESGVAAGLFRPLDLVTTVAAIGAMGLRIPSWFRPDRGPSIDTLADIQAGLALRMLGARETS